MKRKIRAAALVLAVILALPAFEGWGGQNEVKASGYGPDTTASNPPPGGAGSGSGTTTTNPSGNVPSTKPKREKEEVREEPGSIWIHEHAFEYVRVQEATETQDAVIQLQCSCGAAGESIAEAGSSVRFFIERVIRDIENAPQNGTVTIDTKIWTCYNREVMEALAQRPDVTLVTNYCYEHVDYTVTIPAGYEVDTLLDENGYCGFRYLDQVLGGSRAEEK